MSILLLGEVAKYLKEHNSYQHIPSDVKRFGSCRMPYEIIEPRKDPFDVVIIYFHGIDESFETARTRASVITEITHIPTIVFEYCGFFEGSAFSTEFLLCSLLGMYAMALQRVRPNKVFLLSNAEGSEAAVELIESCRKQKLAIGGAMFIVCACDIVL